MLIKTFIIIGASLLFNSYANAKVECGDGVIKYVNSGKRLEEKEKFCIDMHKENKMILSIDCREKKCHKLANPAAYPVDISKYNKTIGSPGFKVCKELGGQPQIIEYRLLKNKYFTQGSRCIFSKNSFVSNDILIRLWKYFIIK